MENFTHEQLLEIKKLIAIKDVKGRVYKKLIDTIWDGNDESHNEKNIYAALKASEEHNAATMEFLNYLKSIKKDSTTSK